MRYQTKQNHFKKGELKMSLDILLARAKQENQPEVFYDFSDPLIRAFAIKNTPCFASYLAKDSECQICPLASDCQASKMQNEELKAKQKAYKEEHKEEIEAEKVKTTLMKKIPSSVSLANYKYVPQVAKEITSKLSDTVIPVGSPAFWITSYGLITKDEGLTLGLVIPA